MKALASKVPLKAEHSCGKEKSTNHETDSGSWVVRGGLRECYVDPVLTGHNENTELGGMLHEQSQKNQIK